MKPIFASLFVLTFACGPNATDSDHAGPQHSGRQGGQRAGVGAITPEALASTSEMQTFKISGKVTTQAGTPVPGAIVSLATGTPSAPANTGTYTLRVWIRTEEDRRETFHLCAVAPGFEKVCSRISIRNSSIVPSGTLDFQLVRKPVPAGAHAFVSKVFTTMIKREPSAAELQAWAQELAGYPYPVVATRIIQSPERRGPIINGYYLKYLGRQSERAGLEHWIGSLDRGLDFDQAQLAIIGSKEYYELGGGTPEGFVAKLYADVLNRTADASEIAFWVKGYRAVGGVEVAKGFIISNERKTKAVTAWFQEILGRAPRSDELTNIVARLNGGARTESIQGELLGSAEFIQK